MYTISKEIENDAEYKKMITEVKAFAKECRRLEKKYGYWSEKLNNKSLDELVQMWLNDYFELYFMDYVDEIIETGGKKYAQYYLHIRGVVPEEEVELWK